MRSMFPWEKTCLPPPACRYQKRQFGVDTHFAFPLEFRSIQAKTKGISFAFLLYRGFFGEGSRERLHFACSLSPEIKRGKKGDFSFLCGKWGALELISLGRG